MSKGTIILLICIIAYSCSNKHKLSSDEALDTTNKKIVLNGHSLKELTKSKTLENKEFKIIVYYNGNCSFCYLELAKWKNIEEEFAKKQLDVSFVYLLSGYNKPLVKSSLEQMNPPPLSKVYYVNEEEIKNINPFFLDGHYENSSALVDKDDNLLSIGNPTISLDDKNKYLKIVEKQN